MKIKKIKNLSKIIPCVKGTDSHESGQAMNHVKDKTHLNRQFAKRKTDIVNGFIKNYARRIVDKDVFQSEIHEDLEPYVTELCNSGFKMLTNQDRPDLLRPGQMLLWPISEATPKKTIRAITEPICPSFNPNDGRLFVPGHNLTKEEITNHVFEGDCLDILPLFPAHSVDMILCDLPYGTTQNKWDSVISLDRLWSLYRHVLKPNGVVVLTAQGVFTAKIILSNEPWFKYKIIWEKSKPTNFLNAKIQPLRKHEDVCVFYNKPPTYCPQMRNGSPYDKGVRKNQLSGSYGDFMPAHVHSSGERYPTDVVYFKTAESEGPVWHPTQKPVELGCYLIRTFTKPGDLVLDNACGSGSFIVAAAREGRRFVGVEKNEDVHLFKRNSIDYVGVTLMRLAHLKQVQDRIL